MDIINELCVSRNIKKEEKMPRYLALVFAIAVASSATEASTAQAADLSSSNALPTLALPAPVANYQLYVRGDIGGSWLAEGTGYWTGSNKKEPRYTDSISSPGSFTGGAAIGIQFVPGVRADISYDYLGAFSVHGVSTASLSGLPTADARVVSNLAMMNFFIEPLRFLNIYSGNFQPFVTVGGGYAFNDFGDWSRYQPSADHSNYYRTFAGSSQTNWAWSVGGGVSVDIGNVFNHPAFLDLTYRYIDAGHVNGGVTPLTDSSKPVREAYNFTLATNVATIGLRIPFSQ
jgi:hypothetical protein